MEIWEGPFLSMDGRTDEPKAICPFNFFKVGGNGPPLKNHKKYSVISDTDPDPLENHKATKSAFNVGP